MVSSGVEARFHMSLPVSLEKPKSSPMMGNAQCHRVIAAVGVVYGVKGVLMVGAPIRPMETCVAAQDDPVNNVMDEGVHGGAVVEAG